MSKPLQDKRIVVTRSAAQAPAFCQQLAALGATPIPCPAIELIPLPTTQLDAALQQLDRYDWLVFTSGNAVHFFFDNQNASIKNQKSLRIAASGSATAKRLQQRHITPDFIPDSFVGEALVAGLGDLTGKRILLPRAKIGRPKIARLMRQAGGIVDDIPLYDTITAVPDPTILEQITQGVDVFTFTSPSSVRNFLKIATNHNLPSTIITDAHIACIGPITADELRKQGQRVTIIPDEYTITALTQAIADYYVS